MSGQTLEKKVQVLEALTIVENVEKVVKVTESTKKALKDLSDHIEKCNKQNQHAHKRVDKTIIGPEMSAEARHTSLFLMDLETPKHQMDFETPIQIPTFGVSKSIKNSNESRASALKVN